MNNIINTFVKIIGYCIFLFGIWLVVSPFIAPAVKRVANYTRFRSIKVSSSKKQDSKFIQHINMVLHIVLNKNYHGVAYSFIVLSVCMFVVTFLMLITGGQSLLFALLFSLLLGLLPYLITRVRLVVIRIEGSYEAEVLVTELNNQYKICNLNMIEAMDRTLPKLNNCRYTQKALFRLTMAIKEYNSDEQLDSIINEFVYSIDTEWAALLGINIKIAVSDGRDVRPSLDDILIELKQIKDILEKDKRNNNESFSMIKFIVPAVYVLSVFVAVNFFGFTLNKYFDYQFRTDIGLKFAFLTFTSMVINYVVSYLISKPKYDI